MRHLHRLFFLVLSGRYFMVGWIIVHHNLFFRQDTNLFKRATFYIDCFYFEL